MVRRRIYHFFSLFQQFSFTAQPPHLMLCANSQSAIISVLFKKGVQIEEFLGILKNFFDRIYRVSPTVKKKIQDRRENHSSDL